MIVTGPAHRELQGAMQARLYLRGSCGSRYRRLECSEHRLLALDCENLCERLATDIEAAQQPMNTVSLFKTQANAE